MARGLDHIVHAARDLDRAAELYRRLGFTVGARNRHPWGTHNHIVQFPGCFIELLAFVEPEKLGGDAISSLFAAYNRDFAAVHEGLSMLILESQDSGHDVSDFRVAGIAASETLRFEREARRPDGSAVKVGFSLAFAEDRKAPQIHFATCQQHYPENFWNPAFQRHANGATGIAEAVVVSNSPDAHRAMLLAFTGADTAEPTPGGYTIALPRGRLTVMTAADFSRRYGVAAPDVGSGARIAALRFDLAGPNASETRIESVFGATLLFSAAG